MAGLIARGLGSVKGQKEPRAQIALAARDNSVLWLASTHQIAVCRHPRRASRRSIGLTLVFRWPRQTSTGSDRSSTIAQPRVV